MAHAGVSLAQMLGAETILLFGIDFAYPEGKTYARGTYLYPYFDLAASRTAPLETHFWQFLFRSDALLKEKRDTFTLYTNRSMLTYKERMEQSIAEMDALVKQEPGLGLNLRIRPKEHPAQELHFESTIRTLFSLGACKMDWKVLLKEYYAKVQKLSFLPYAPLGKYFDELSHDEKLVLLTLLPASTAIREKHGANNGLTGSKALLEKTKAWTLACLEQYI